MKKKIISLAIVVTLSTGLNAQPAIDTTQQSQLLIENLLEELAEKENLNEEALEAISDNMLNLFDNPVNINDTLPENLNQLPLSELQVNSIIDYIRKHEETHFDREVG